jgi:hypothetical protein
MDDDDSNTSHSSTYHDPIEDFFDSYTDTIIDFYFELQNRFAICNPYFLSYMKSPDITDLFIYTMFTTPPNLESYHFLGNQQSLYNNFLTAYQNDLETSYRLLCYFFPRQLHIPYSYWQMFCFRYTDLSELY